MIEDVFFAFKKLPSSTEKPTSFSVRNAIRGDFGVLDLPATSPLPLTLLPLLAEGGREREISVNCFIKAQTQPVYARLRPVQLGY